MKAEKMKSFNSKIFVIFVCYLLTISLYGAKKEIHSTPKVVTYNTLNVPQQERDALIAFYNATAGANWTNTLQGKGAWPVDDPNVAVTSWNATTNTGWYGVTVANGHVISLSLYSNNLTGELPISLFTDLPNLGTIHFYNNKISGSIPNEIGNLTLLGLLRLDNNQLTGSIPTTVGNLMQLYEVRLGSNKLSGSIPLSVGNLLNISMLWINGNLLSGDIPSTIGNLNKLKSLNLENNTLSGEIPITLGNLSSLEFLSLWKNKLTGDIPIEIGNLSNLKILQLGSNPLTGVIPSSLGNLSNLQTLQIADTYISGSIPMELVNLNKLGNLYLNSNQLSGTIPDIFSNMPSLVKLWLSGNQLTGEIPSSIGSLTSLQNLSLQGNLLSGEFPQSLKNLANLKTFSFLSNRFRFVDFEDVYNYFKLNLPALNYGYAPQGKIDSPKNEMVSLGSSYTLKMYEDDRFTTSETYQWYKNNVLLSGATSRTLTLSNFALSDAGSYHCVTKHPVITDVRTPPNYALELALMREPITLTVNNCPSVTGNLLISSIWEGSPNCIGHQISFGFSFDQAPSTTYNYFWNFSGPVLLTSQEQNPTVSFSQAGVYFVTLRLTDPNGCEYYFNKKIVIEDCNSSCTYGNTQYPTVKALFLDLIHKLVSLPPGSVTPGYSCPELVALAPYITDPNPGIYNFSYTSSQNTLSFSFSNHSSGEAWNDMDVRIDSYMLSPSLDDIIVVNYISPEEQTLFHSLTNGTWIPATPKSFVKHINFCPSSDNCRKHIAIVVDESGSIDQTEARKIRSQLSSFINKTASENDLLGTNIRISLIGLSDSDTDTRTDHVIINNRLLPSNKQLYLDWIANYKNNTTISAASDYWKSGLDKALSLSPDAVILITDGCQTASVTGLKTTMEGFDNNNGAGTTPANKPHLFVIGIQEGFYIDKNSTFNKSGSVDKNSDPNYNTSLKTSNTTLELSLQFLMKYDQSNPANFPLISKYDFSKDYFATDSFNFLYEEQNYLSNGLIGQGYACGEIIPYETCDNCLNFKPEPGKEYVLGAWVMEEQNIQVTSYNAGSIEIRFYSDKEKTNQIGTQVNCISSGAIIEGWQRIFKKFTVPQGANYIEISLLNSSVSVPVYFDDIRLHPLDGSMKSFVYDPETFRLMSELDENNYSTFYEYDKEGGLIRVKKETSRGVKTIQETRSGNVIKQ